MTTLRTFLEQASQFHIGRNIPVWSMEEFVLKFGKEFVSAPLTDDEERIVCEAAARQTFSQKQCFSNSQMLVLADRTEQLRYSEGFVFFVIPIHHGWATINNKIVDVTLRIKPAQRKTGKLKDRNLGEFKPPLAYFGVQIVKEEICKYMVQTGMAGSLIDDWERGFPLRKKENESKLAEILYRKSA